MATSSYIDSLIAQAEQADAAQDSPGVLAACNAILETDPDNDAAWYWLAIHSGWDAKSYETNMDDALAAIRQYLSLLPESQRFEAASQIYFARKQQISGRVESAMLMPSITSSKHVHEAMMDWKRYLAEIPNLSPSVIEGEATLCDNLCLRSKMAIMPGERMIYTAYASFNGKVPYGEEFRSVLEARKAEESQLRWMESVQETLSNLEARYQALMASSISQEEEIAFLTEALAILDNERKKVLGLSDKSFHENHRAELQGYLQSLKPYKLLKRKEVQDQIGAIDQKLAQIDESIQVVLEPIDTQIQRYQLRLQSLQS